MVLIESFYCIYNIFKTYIFFGIGKIWSAVPLIIEKKKKTMSLTVDKSRREYVTDFSFFTIQDRRKLMACYQQHMLMAKLPECLWKKVCLAIERTGPVNEKFFGPLMRIKDEAVIDKCLQTLISVGQKEYKDMM